MSGRFAAELWSKSSFQRLCSILEENNGDFEMQIKALIYIGIKIFLLSIIFSPESAQENPDREGFRAGLDLGVGMLDRTFPEGKADENNFYMGFNGGYWLNPHIVTGLELSGWLLQADPLGPDEPEKGEGISRVFLYTQLYPSTDFGWFVILHSQGRNLL